MNEHPDLGSHPSFDHLAHRPWPLPAGRWVARQSWRDLLFAHWPVPVAAVRPLVPAALEVQQFDGVCWLGIVPFRMADVMARGLPALPWFSAFPELNVRVYVTAEGKPGVWFLSLDATNPLAVIGARVVFHLPYYWARMRVENEGEGVRYWSERRGDTRENVAQAFLPAGEPGSGGAGEKGGRGERERPAAARFEGRYWPTSEVYCAALGTLEHFLTERYCLYAQAPNGIIRRTEIHHGPWPLQRAEAEITANTVSAAGGLPVSGPPALLHFARRIDMVLWRPERVSV